MNIAIVGSGYVGLVSGACFSDMGNTVTCVDSDKDKIDQLNKGIIPIYEPGLESIILNNCEKGNLTFTTSLEGALRDCEIVFIAVGTPMGEDGSADLQYVLAVAKEIGQLITDSIVVVNKSTVPVGTADRVKKIIAAELSIREVEIPFSIVSNPEFLKEGAAISDFMKPDRIVVGVENKHSEALMRRLYRPFTVNHDRFISMDLRSAEMTKYAANAFLATKISFINEMSNISERLGADINMVREGIGSDKRIGFEFIYPGCGYGGSCFPKDVQALVKMSEEVGYNSELVKAVNTVNVKQKLVLVEKVISVFGENLSGVTLAVWGLSYKPETSDMRESPAITIVNELTGRGAKIQAYDPQAMKGAENHYLKGNSRVTYCETKYKAIENVDALLLITEWKEFRSPDFTELKSRMKSAVVFDGRNQYVNYQLDKMGFDYYLIGKQ
ncbi:MAG: UDP-glucose/GDP-mannose dehydrogenase family protein [Bacteroidetes bacterium]|nr:UDP-glucose/GDP-mannose dehydrogenase family protein [Bacteroidota bacterium]MDA0981278.1 UDP-glucose/GDP-mannose dehydrogenase family protein [Bacteroidota bacterium]